jgi:hypothetical protein
VLNRVLTATYLQSAHLRERWFQSWGALNHQISVIDALWLLEKSELDGIDHSLVNYCVAPALQEARSLLGLWVEEALPPAIAHITLYTENDPHGISVANDHALHERRIASGPWSAFGLSYPAGE